MPDRTQLHEFDNEHTDLARRGVSDFSPVESVTVAVDDLAPAAPSGVSATAIAEGIRLAWTNPSTNADGTTCVDMRWVKIYYRSTTGVSKSVNDGSYAFGGRAGDTHNYPDRMAAGTARYYVVTALDGNNNESVESSEVNATAGAVDPTTNIPDDASGLIFDDTYGADGVVEGDSMLGIVFKNPTSTWVTFDRYRLWYQYTDDAGVTWKDKDGVADQWTEIPHVPRTAYVHKALNSTYGYRYKATVVAADATESSTADTAGGAATVPNGSNNDAIVATIVLAENVTATNEVRGTHISAATTISINDRTFGNDGIQLDYNSGNPRAYIGDGANQYFSFNGTNIAWKGTNSELTTAGVMTLGDSSNEHVYITTTAVQLKNGATVYTDLTNAVLTLGDSSNEHTLINTSGIALKDGATTYAVFAATTIIGATATEHVSITSSTLQFKDGGTVYTELTGGNLSIGNTTNEHVYVTSTAVQIKNGATVYTDLTNAVLTLGDSSNEHVLVNTSGIALKDGASVYGVFAATTTLGLTASEHVNITSTSIQFKDGGTVYTDLTAGALTLGDSSNENVLINTSGVQLRDSTTVYGSFAATTTLGNAAAADGYFMELTASNLKFYERDTSASILRMDLTDTALLFYDTDGTTQLASFGATVLVGQQAASQSNVYITAGALQLRTNTTVNAELTNAGVLILGDDAGGEYVHVDSTGIEIWGGAVKRFEVTSAGLAYLGDQSNEHIKLSASGLQVYDGANLLATYGASTTFYDTGGADRLVLGTTGITVGDVTEGEYTIIDSTDGIRMYGGGTVHAQLTNAGLFWVGDTTTTERMQWDSTNGLRIFNSNNIAITVFPITGDATISGWTTGATTFTSGTRTGTITVVDWSKLTLDTLTIEINGSSTVLTEGTDWDNLTSNDVTAESIKEAVTALTGVTATRAGAVVTATAEAGYAVTALATSADSDGMTVALPINLLLDSSGKKICINSGIFSNDGIQLDYNSGNPRFYVGDGANAYVNFDGTKLTWKAANTELDTSGDLTATNVDLTGTITATKGTIGGWTLAATTLTGGNLTLDSGNTKITAGTGNDIIAIDAADADYRLAIGHSAYGSAPFRVTKAGALTATGVTVSGAITATSGTIGGFTIDSTEGLYTGTGATRIQMKAGTGLWLGATAFADAPFRVTPAGALVATSANIAVPTAAGEALRLSGTATANGNAYLYVTISREQYLLVSGDTLSYDIFISLASPAFNTGVDITFTDTSALRDAGLSDQNSVAAHPSTDLSSYAKGQWYHREIDLSTLAGKTTDYLDVALEGDAAGAYHVYVANVIIENAGTLKKAYWTDGVPSAHSAHMTASYTLDEIINTGAGTQWVHSSDFTKIDGGNIYTNTVTATQINVTNLAAINADLGTVTAGTITTVTLDFAQITRSALSVLNSELAGSITSDKISSISATTITAGTMTGRTVQTSSSGTRVVLSAEVGIGGGQHTLAIFDATRQRTLMGAGALTLYDTSGNADVYFGAAAVDSYVDCSSFGVITHSAVTAFAVNQGSGNGTADDWVQYSLGRYKEDLREASVSLDTIKQLNLFDYRRIPFVSAKELRDAVIAEFGIKRWEKLYPDDKSYRGGVLWDCPDSEIKTFLDECGDTLRAERRELPKWKHRHYGMIADDTSTREFAPELIAYDDADNVIGLALGDQIGFLFTVVQELARQVEILQR